jgi:hypothetical protein
LELAKEREPTCRQCKTKRPKSEMFSPPAITGWICKPDISPKCVVSLADEKKSKKAQQEHKAWKAETRRRRLEHETLASACAKAQGDCNWYIRERDWFKPCLTCGKPIEKIGTNYHAGHVFAIGSKNQCNRFRFDERNIHGQCLSCNSFKGGRKYEALLALAVRYGPEYVQELEEANRRAEHGENEPLTKDEVRAMAKEWRRKARELQRRRKQLVA